MVAKENKTRIRYSRFFKRDALIKLIQGEKPADILEDSGFDLKKLFIADKKYALKLINKWRRKIYEDKDRLNILSQKLDDENLNYEINLSIYENDASNRIISELLEPKLSEILGKKEKSL